GEESVARDDVPEDAMLAREVRDPEARFVRQRRTRRVVLNVRGEHARRVQEVEHRAGEEAGSRDVPGGPPDTPPGFLDLGLYHAPILVTRESGCQQRRPFFGHRVYRVSTLVTL